MFLALNISPATVLLLPERDLCEPQLCPRIVIELTEHVPIEDYSLVHRALQGKRRTARRGRPRLRLRRISPPHRPTA